MEFSLFFREVSHRSRRFFYTYSSHIFVKTTSIPGIKTSLSLLILRSSFLSAKPYLLLPLSSPSPPKQSCCSPSTA